MWCIIKKHCEKNYTFYLFYGLSFSFGQNIESKKISEVDSICSNINCLKKSEYKTFQSSGLINKKIFIFFKKNIGSFNEDVRCIGNEILKITYVEFLNGKVKNERYYFSKNKLIKYEIRNILMKKELRKSEINAKAYYDNNKLLKFWSDKDTAFDFLKTLEKSNELNSNSLEFQDNNNNDTTTTVYNHC